MFRKLRGKPSKDLMRNGLLGRGLITNIEGTNVATGVGPDPKHVCIFTLEVALDNVPRYHATCRQAVSQVLLPALASGEPFVAVRVNPDDHSEVAIDFDEALPEVRMTRNDPKAGSAAQVLAEGLPCRVVIVESAPMSPWILFTIGGRFRWCAGSRERRITVYGLVFRGGDVASGSISLPHSDAP